MGKWAKKYGTDEEYSFKGRGTREEPVIEKEVPEEMRIPKNSKPVHLPATPGMAEEAAPGKPKGGILMYIYGISEEQKKKKKKKQGSNLLPSYGD